MQNLKKHLKIPWDLSHSLRIMGIPAVILFRLIAVSMETGRVPPLILINTYLTPRNNSATMGKVGFYFCA